MIRAYRASVAGLPVRIGTRKAMLLRPHPPTVPAAAKRRALPAAQVKSRGRGKEREGAEYVRIGRQPHVRRALEAGGGQTAAMGPGLPGRGMSEMGGYVVLRGRPGEAASPRGRARV